MITLLQGLDTHLYPLLPQQAPHGGIPQRATLFCAHALLKVQRRAAAVHSHCSLSAISALSVLSTNYDVRGVVQDYPHYPLTLHPSAVDPPRKRVERPVPSPSPLCRHAVDSLPRPYAPPAPL